jgi:ABC-type transport system involved in cytochrome bd biosynthesis fused ATPase/permease subunit
MKKRFIRDQTAEGYIDVAITMLIVFTLMASLMALFPLFTAQQSLNQTARYMARTVELYGKADDTTLNSVTEDGDFTVPDSVDVETQWHDESQKTIQLKTRFTVTVSRTVPIVILRPALGDPLVINVRISASANGISEVYWK